MAVSEVVKLNDNRRGVRLSLNYTERELKEKR
jgi:hypothetical protein